MWFEEGGRIKMGMKERMEGLVMVVSDDRRIGGIYLLVNVTFMTCV